VGQPENYTGQQVKIRDLGDISQKHTDCKQQHFSDNLLNKHILMHQHHRHHKYYYVEEGEKSINSNRKKNDKSFSPCSSTSLI
jgi:hypothetical protein